MKSPLPAPISLARNPRGIAGAARLRDIDRNTPRPQPLQRRTQHLAAPPASRRRIHNRQIGFGTLQRTLGKFAMW